MRLGEKTPFGELATLAKKNALVGIKWLSIEDVKLTSEKIILLAKVLSHIPTLETFIMTRQGIIPSMSPAIIYVLPHSLRTLDLSYTGGVWNTCVKIKEKLPNLEALLMNGCLGTEFSHPFPPTLKTLELKDNVFDKKDITDLAVAVREVPDLSVLDLRGSDVSRKQMDILVENVPPTCRVLS